MTLLAVRAPYAPAFAPKRPLRAVVAGPVRAVMGAPITAPVLIGNPDDDRSYVATVDPAVQDHDKDVRAQFVYRDPAEVEAALKTSAADVVPGFRDYWETELTKLKSRAAGKSNTQVAQEVDYGGRWQTFYESWLKEKKDVETLSDPKLANFEWTQINNEFMSTLTIMISI